MNAFISASMGAISGVADDFITSKQATAGAKKIIQSIPRMSKGNAPKVKIPTRKKAAKFVKRAARSIFSIFGWGTSTSSVSTWATGKVRRAR